MALAILFSLFFLPTPWIEEVVDGTVLPSKFTRISIPIVEDSSPRAEEKIPNTETTKTTVAKKVSGSSTKTATTPIQSPQTSPQQVSPLAPQPRQEEDFRALVEIYILEKTNIERAKYELSFLTADTSLQSIARDHSSDMFEKSYFAHEDPNGCSSSCRAKQNNYTYSSIGENIYMMKGYTLSPEHIAQKIVDGWMGSPGHRENILREVFTHIGIGVVAEGKSVYATAMYAKPR